MSPGVMVTTTVVISGLPIFNSHAFVCSSGTGSVRSRTQLKVELELIQLKLGAGDSEPPHIPPA